MIVNSRQLELTAQELRRRKRGPMRIQSERVWINSAQCDRAARILREAEPCVVTSPVHLASTQERPGFIEAAAQDIANPDVLVFQVGIIPNKIYRITRRGKVLGEDSDRPR